MRLHLPAIPHTVTDARHSHCAFTGKVKRFGPMLRAQGFDVVHYGVSGSDAGATDDVIVMDQQEHLGLLGRASYFDDPTRTVGTDAVADNAVYRAFNARLRAELSERLEPGDVLCLPFGSAHDDAWKGLALIDDGAVSVVETGIGYPRPSAYYRVYESEAWRHWVMGDERREGMAWGSPRREWVIPNYYDVSEWPVVDRLDSNARNTVVFLGRVCDIKGLALVPRLAHARPDLRFVICGQGDPAPYLGLPNVEYRVPITGVERAEYLGNARCLVAPSRFVEPFCGVAVEAQLCGTPVVTSDFGAFTETVIDGVTGIRCRGDGSQWLKALDAVPLLDRRCVAELAVQRFSTEVVGRRYAEAFQEVGEEMQIANDSPLRNGAR